MILASACPPWTGAGMFCRKPPVPAGRTADGTDLHSTTVIPGDGRKAPDPGTGRRPCGGRITSAGNKVIPMKAARPGRVMMPGRVRVPALKAVMSRKECAVTRLQPPLSQAMKPGTRSLSGRASGLCGRTMAHQMTGYGQHHAGTDPCQYLDARGPVRITDQCLRRTAQHAAIGQQPR